MITIDGKEFESLEQAKSFIDSEIERERKERVENEKRSRLEGLYSYLQENLQCVVVRFGDASHIVAVLADKVDADCAIAKAIIPYKYGNPYRMVTPTSAKKVYTVQVMDMETKMAFLNYLVYKYGEQILAGNKCKFSECATSEDQLEFGGSSFASFMVCNYTEKVVKANWTPCDSFMGIIRNLF